MGCRSAILAASIAVACAYAGGTPASASNDDGVTLLMTPGGSASQVQLNWTGGTPQYRVFRATVAPGLVTPAHQVGSTPGLSMLDTPPAGATFFYSVVPPCTSNPYCGAGEYCDSSGLCAVVQPDGEKCTGNGECQSGYCNNGYCCASGTCCATAANCIGFSAPSSCGSPSTCQGTRLDGACTTSFQCASSLVQDDSGCAGTEAEACGAYPSVFCTSAVSQSSNQAALCATNCLSDTGCDTSAHCEALGCVPDYGPGGVCDAATDCQTNLFCTDANCCTSACSGVCQACNLSGTPGTCGPIPSGQDPASECGVVGCAGYYFGFVGDSCLQKADVSAAQAACNGTNGCRTAAQECTAQTQSGPATITCHAACQDPTAGTCTGTTAGTCTNVNPGNQTCGVGVCVRTTPQCVNGAPGPCTPGTPTTEICNDLDENCDGIVDNGAFSDSYEPNPSCAAPRVLATVGSDQTLGYTDLSRTLWKKKMA